jgi:hypothetical protein
MAVGTGYDGASTNLPAQDARSREAGATSLGARLFRERLGKRELKRRACHMLPGCLPYLLWVVPHHDPKSPIFLAAISGVLVAVALAIYFYFSRIQREGEHHRDRVIAIVGYAGSVLAMLLLFPGYPELAFTVLAVLAFGDGSAHEHCSFCEFVRRCWPRSSRVLWSRLTEHPQIGMSFSVRALFPPLL